MKREKSPRNGSAHKLQRSPIHLFHRAGQRATEIFQTEMADQSLTPRQFAVLVAVAEHEGMSQTELVAITGIDRSTLADIVLRMLKKGFVQRRRTKEDARAYAVKLTELGRDLLSRTEPLVAQVDERILAALTPAQRERFVDELGLIVDALGASESPDAG